MIPDIALAVAIMKQMPDNAANSAQRAEDAADRAELYGQLVEVSSDSDKITITIGGDST